MDLTVAFIGAGLLTIAAASDLRIRLIPNVLPVAITLLALLRLAVGADLASAEYALAAATAVFAVGLICFRYDLMGGGDVKLMTATALLVGPGGLPVFLFVMSLAGAGLSVAFLSLRASLRASIIFDRADSSGQEAPRHHAVPYGVAIAAGGLWALSAQILYG